ncbi:hypothetical protein Clacol_008154 [Clathrus columnatus]|uniref:Nuclear movement protein nudC n=1 Tax=Clathrus columnatus TaxID=1419009 RepID=A0AAV5AJH0_9AGAM|nr:hypothetical protein Clacol_008154 [Clathrus columnatus]
MSTPDDYDKMTPDERDAFDKAERAREAAEQATLPYKWKQELGEVSITVSVPKGTRAKNLDIVMQKRKLRVAIKGQEPIMEGELCKDIKVEDSTWGLEDQEFINIHLEKVNKQQWWENVLTHHPKIDTTKIVPENSKLSDLDGETRGMVEKMMFYFDTSLLKQLGKPTSDELKKLESKSVKLRPYQESCLQACLGAFEEGTRRIGVSLPTGSGKTTVFVSLINRLPPRGKATRALVIVNSVELARQAANQVSTMFPQLSVEIEQGTKYHASGSADITVATYQTLLQPPRIAKFDPGYLKAIVVDEAHHSAAPSYVE